jgi:hypothetical protein
VIVRRTLFEESGDVIGEQIRIQGETYDAILNQFLAEAIVSRYTRMNLREGIREVWGITNDR